MFASPSSLGSHQYASSMDPNELLSTQYTKSKSYFNTPKRSVANFHNYKRFNVSSKKKKLVLLKKNVSQEAMQTISKELATQNDRDIINILQPQPYSRTLIQPSTNFKPFPKIFNSDLPKRKVIGQVEDFKKIHQEKTMKAKKQSDSMPRSRLSIIFMNNINQYLQKYNKVKTEGLTDLEKMDDKFRTQVLEIAERINKDKEEHKENMQKLSIGVKLKETKHERVFNNYNHYVHDWERFKNTSSVKVQKHEQDLLISNSEQFRESIEARELIEKTLTVPERLGQDYWQLTLRKPDDVPDVKFKCYKKLNKFSDLQLIKVEGHLQNNYLKIKHFEGLPRKMSTPAPQIHILDQELRLEESDDQLINFQPVHQPPLTAKHSTRHERRFCFAHQTQEQTRNLEVIKEAGHKSDFVEITAHQKLAQEMDAYQQQIDKIRESQILFSKANTRYRSFQNLKFDSPAKPNQHRKSLRITNVKQINHSRQMQQKQKVIFDSLKEEDSNPNYDPKTEEIIEVHYNASDFY